MLSISEAMKGHTGSVWERDGPLGLRFRLQTLWRAITGAAQEFTSVEEDDVTSILRGGGTLGVSITAGGEYDGLSVTTTGRAGGVALSQMVS